MDSAARRALVGDLRAMMREPELLGQYRIWATDILVEAAGRAEGKHFDPQFRELDADQREAYLSELAESLAPWLLRSVLTWAAFEAELTTDWRERQAAASRR